MAIKAGMKYNGTVREGSHPFESQTGTPGYQVMLKCEDGDTSFTIWMTEKNRDKAIKYFTVLGADLNRFDNATYIEFELGREIVGREVCFGTREHEYLGRTSIQVAWIGKKSEGTPVQSMAAFFGKKGAVANTVTRPAPEPAPDWVNDLNDPDSVTPEPKANQQGDDIPF